MGLLPSMHVLNVPWSVGHSFVSFLLQRKDLLQLLIDAGTGEEDEDIEHHEQTTSTRRPLTNGEIASYCITFMLAGYETTANTLAFTAYLLATNPQVQDKLCDEIDLYFQQHPVREH